MRWSRGAMKAMKAKGTCPCQERSHVGHSCSCSGSISCVQQQQQLCSSREQQSDFLISDHEKCIYICMYTWGLDSGF